MFFSSVVVNIWFPLFVGWVDIPAIVDRSAYLWHFWLIHISKYKFVYINRLTQIYSKVKINIYISKFSLLIKMVTDGILK